MRLIDFRIGYVVMYTQFFLLAMHLECLTTLGFFYQRCKLSKIVLFVINVINLLYFRSLQRKMRLSKDQDGGVNFSAVISLRF